MIQSSYIRVQHVHVSLVGEILNSSLAEAEASLGTSPSRPAPSDFSANKNSRTSKRQEGLELSKLQS